MSNRVSTNKKLIGVNRFYYIIYFFIIINQILAQSQFNESTGGEFFLKGTRWLLMGCFFVIIVYKSKYPRGWKGLFWFLYILITIIEMIFFGGKLLMLMLGLIVLASHRIDTEKLLAIHIKALVIGTCFVVFCSLVGILDPKGVSKGFDNLTGFLGRPTNMRYALGFTHANIIPLITLFLYLYFIITKRNVYRFKYDLFFLALNFIVYLICGSRICVLLAIFVCLLRIICSRKPAEFMAFATPACVLLLLGELIFTFILPLSDRFYNPMYQKIDLIMTGRLSLHRRILSLFPLKLWGYGELNFGKQTEYLALDNGYLTMFVTRGIIIGALFVVILLLLIWQAKKHNNAYELLFILIMIIGNLVDNSLLHYVTFPIYIMMYNVFVGDLDFRKSERNFRRRKIV